MPVEPAVLRASRIRKLRAGGALTDEQIARLSNLDFLIDSADDELDALLADLGIADPADAEGDDAQPAMAGMNADRLRTRIRAAATRGDLEARDHFRAAYRSLPAAERRESCTAAIWRGELRRAEDTREIVRSVEPAAEIRAALVEWRGAQVPAAADAQPTLFGHFAVFDTWTEVDSFWEGLFMERIAPGSFASTIKSGGQKVTFNHGRDKLGNLVLGSITSLAEDKVGAAYEVSLNDGVDPLLVSGLRRGQYGASFRFFVNAERIDEKPKPSAYNPRGIPERTILEADVDEFGPVTFPQYPEASAQLRSLIPMRAPPPARDSGTRSEKARPIGQEEFLECLLR